MRLLLDTDTCVYISKQQVPAFPRYVASKARDIAISVITEAELRFGAANSARPRNNDALLDAFLAPLTILELTSVDARTYGTVRTRLEQAGAVIGPLDMLIGAQAIANGLVLVTNNEREFRRIRGLRLQNWMQ